MAKGFIGNITAEKYNAWLRMTPSERKELARKIAAEKKEKERIEKEADAQYWRDFRDRAQFQSGGDNATISGTPMYDYRGQSELGEEGQSNIGASGSDVTGYEEEGGGISNLDARIAAMARKRMAQPETEIDDPAIIPEEEIEEVDDEISLTDYRGLSDLGERGPSNIGAWGDDVPVEEDDSQGFLEKSRLSRGLRAGIEDANRGLGEKQGGVELGHMFEPSEEEDQLSAAMSGDYVYKTDSSTGRGKDAREYYSQDDAGYAPSLVGDDEAASETYSPATLKRLTEISDQMNKLQNLRESIKEKKEIRDEGGTLPKEHSAIHGADSDVWEELDRERESKGGLINLKQKLKEKEKVDKQKDAVTEVAIAKEEDKGATGDFVRYDDRNYPIYKKMSKWAKSFNDAFARAVEEGKEVFSWTGHDGISRQYTAERALKNAEEPTPPSDNPVTDSQMAEMSDPSDLMPQITDYQKVKTKEEKEEVIKKAEKNATTVEEKKAIRATVKQEADEYWIDPLTGFALNLSQLKRKIKRKEIMEFASTLPADMRALYYKQQKLIDPEDFDALIKDKKEKDALERKFKNLQIRTQEYKLITAERAAETDPQRAEHLKMYLNAGNNDNYSLQVYLGKKLGLDQGILDLAKEAHMEHELAKLDAKKKGVGGKKLFSDRFLVDYSTVITNKSRWIDNASSMIQTTGRYANILQLDGTTKQVDRAPYFRSYGLKEHKDMLALSSNEQVKILKESPFYAGIEEIIKVDGNPPTLDPSLFLRDKDAYEMYLKNTLVYYGMKDLYGEKKYNEMLKWVENHSIPDNQAMARVNKKLTGGATIVDGKRKVEKGL